VSAPRLHHTGYVVRSIAESAEPLARQLSLTWDGDIIHDPLQMVKVTFLPALVSDEATIELIEPAGARSPVKKFAEAGGGLHHVCYEIDDLKAQIAESQAAGGTLVRVPLPAKAFNGRKIAWIATAQGLLVEYLERG
jgi:methylmalonyl-CoA/ethylmalonyl-CoA epimerase